MLKLVGLLFLVVIVVGADDAICEGENCFPEIAEIAIKVDHETRRLYWYFLRGSDLLY